jgi:protein TonB
LNTFIKQNLVYPNWERENNIQGKVVVNFVVDKNGKIKDGKILSTVQGAKNFDKEVLRLINSMPNWIPGQQDGNKVDVQFNLPIDFKL